VWYSGYSPCGVRPQVQLNQQKFFGNSFAYETREVMHETGHSFGLNHHCNGDSIMNNGASDCNYGSWLIPQHYYSTDRVGINNVYP